jgi:hypothetical protein
LEVEVGRSVGVEERERAASATVQDRCAGARAGKIHSIAAR